MTKAPEILRDVRPTGEVYEPKEWVPVDGVKKPSREFVKQAARKLAGKPYAPKDEPAIAVVINALVAACMSEAHVNRTVGKILDELPRWPDVTDIRQVALETRDVESRPNPGCPRCDGSGFRSEVRRQDGPLGPQNYTYSVRCNCWQYVRITQ
jgi:hypothetical protein